MQGRTWRSISENKEKEVRSLIIKNGGVTKPVTNTTEKWRLSLVDSTYIFYHNGTLYATPSNSSHPVVSKCLSEIETLFTVETSGFYDYLIGFDETGKGEIFGCIYLVGVAIPYSKASNLYSIVSSIDSKKSQSDDYWLKVFQKIDSFQNEGLTYKVLQITPEEIKPKNLNALLDRKYLTLCKSFLNKYSAYKCRMVIDDYGVGSNFKEELSSFNRANLEIVITSQGEDKFLETKVASLISKKYRSEEIQDINNNTLYQFGLLKPGTGNLSNKQTREWLEKWYSSGKEWPWFVKKTFKTIKEIEGKKR
ncbi:MAG: Ribonuclease HIII [candidate division WS2 bacterium]|nr:Ribonuclease HIII [Candidatus Lithacetigena glycinireducens]MBT9175021.1 Ribonuclease HIII [Candidatus Lithacetigena glycinireducens]